MSDVHGSADRIVSPPGFLFVIEIHGLSLAPGRLVSRALSVLVDGPGLPVQDGWNPQVTVLLCPVGLKLVKFSSGKGALCTRQKGGLANVVCVGAACAFHIAVCSTCWELGKGPHSERFLIDASLVQGNFWLLLGARPWVRS